MGGGFAEPRTQVLRRLSVVPVGHQSAVAWILKAMHSFLQRPDNLAAWSLACLFAAVNRDPWTRTLYVASPRLPGSSDGTLTPMLRGPPPLLLLLLLLPCCAAVSAGAQTTAFARACGAVHTPSIVERARTTGSNAAAGSSTAIFRARGAYLSSLS